MSSPGLASCGPLSARLSVRHPARIVMGVAVLAAGPALVLLAPAGPLWLYVLALGLAGPTTGTATGRAGSRCRTCCRRSWSVEGTSVLLTMLICVGGIGVAATAVVEAVGDQQVTTAGIDLVLLVPDALSAAGRRAALVALLPTVFSALPSFAVIGRFWITHHDMLRAVRAADAGVLVVNTALLATVALVPFSTSVLAEYGDQEIAVALYSATVALTAGLQLLLWVWVTRRRLLVASTTRAEIAGTSWGRGAVVVVIVAAIPLVLVSTTLAQLCWLLAFVPTAPFVRGFRRAERRG